MPTSDPDSWAYHDDFAQALLAKDHKIALRLLEAADIALTFARALVAKQYETAHAMLATNLQSSCPPEVLKKVLEDMIGYSGDEAAWPTAVQVVTSADASDMEKWPRKKPQDFGWAYVGVVGVGYCEAVAVTVAEEEERLVIREIQWGRP
jgi:hypothetical protein